MSGGVPSAGVVVTYDCGTTSVKAAVIDLAGRVLGTAVADYSVLRPRPGWVEQDPDALWQAMGTVGRAALDAAGPGVGDRVLACVPVAPWKAIIPLGADGRPLRPAITWLDDRAAEVRAELSQRLGAGGGPWTSSSAALSGADYWSKLNWFVGAESAIWARARHVVGMNTYLKWRATGVLATESSDDFLHAPNDEVAPYYAQVLEALGISPDDPRFPPTLSSTEIVGTVTTRASEELGLPAGTPVLNGFGDLPAITLGAGAIGDGGTHMYIGSSSWLVNVAPAGTFPEAGFEFVVDRDRTCIAVGTLNSAGLALDWILRQTYRRERDELKGRFWDLLDAEVDAVAGEMGGLIGSHWLNGEPQPIGSDVRAVFLGLSGDHDRRHLVRAVMESVCLTHRMSVERLAARGRLTDAPLRIVGGGATSPVWMQMMADVLGHPVETPHEPRYVGAMGAFYCALVGLEMFPDYAAAAARFTGSGRVFSPRPELRQRYDDNAGIYTQLPTLLHSLSPRRVDTRGAARGSGGSPTVRNEESVRVLVSEFHQETNSFNPYPSDLRFWLDGQRVLEPELVRESVQGQSCALLGIIDALEQSEHQPEIHYGYSMFCRSGGTARQEVLDHYVTRLLESVTAAMPLDGVVLSLHGALQTDEYDDAEAEVVRRLREVVGEDCVVAASTDLHGYISRELVEVVDILAGYQTYPHTDFYETGRRAATLALRAIAGPRRPVLAWAPVPMMVSASAYTDREGSFGELIADAHRRVADGDLLDFSIYQMQPWLDVTQPHSTVLAIAEAPEVAATHAAELARELYSRRHDFEPDLFSIDDTITLAESDGPKPVVLVDSADSGNGGAAGDSMAVAERFLARRSRARAAIVVNDGPAAFQAHELGVGAAATFRIGGSLDPRAVAVEVEATVRSLHDGEFVQEGPAGRGLVQRIGRTAVLRAGTLDILVCEWTAGNGDPQLYRAFGIEPALYDLVVVKANTSFRAAYSAFAGRICPADTPGAAAPVIRELPFERHRREIYPWVDVDDPGFPVEFPRRTDG